MRKLNLIILSIISISAASLAESENYLNKLDPVLKPLILNKGTHLAPMLFSDQDNDNLSDNPVLNTIIKINGNPSVINLSGANVRSVIGDIVTADVPVNSLT